MRLEQLIVALSVVLGASSALAKADLTVNLSSPSGAFVYSMHGYSAQVTNIGTKQASNVSLVVSLPVTQTSPQVHLLGTLGPKDSRCNLVGTQLVCSLGSLARNKSTTVNFQLELPQSAAPLLILANVATSSAENSTANNSAQWIPTLLNFAATVQSGDVSLNHLCTGIGLTSYFECELYPSSITTHTVEFQAGGALSFPENPGYGGSWWRPSAERLRLSYTSGSTIVAEFDGYGVPGGCFEGLTTFPSSSYVSPYLVCPQ